MNINIKDYNINYIDEGKGNVVLLLHGWGASLNSFTNLINLLKSSYRVLAIDFPGFGDSDKLKKSFSVDDYTDIVVDFLEKLNVKDVILVGHSYGGRVILKLNNRENLPFTINKNVLIDAAGLKDKKDFKTKFKIFTFKSLKKLVFLLPISDSKKDSMTISLRRKFGSSDYKNSDSIMQETLVRSVNEDLKNCLPKMRETLIIWGSNDTVTPMWMAKYMEKNISNSGLVVLNGGHFSFIDDPITFLKVIKYYFKLNE